MKNKLLYIGDRVLKVASGADHVNKRNQEFIENIFQVTYYPLIDGFLSKIYLGIVDSYLRFLDIELVRNHYDYVFVPQSLLGRVCKYIKTKYPTLKIIVFFHNIEVQYAKEYKKTAGIKAIPFYLATKYWESQCCQYADYCITLNKRDSILLQDTYGRKSDLELPTSYPDIYDEEKAAKAEMNVINPPIDYLFVGVSFFANTQAVQWFIDKVMPHVNGHFHIIGKGMDKYPYKHLNDRIHIHGYVDDLSEYYYHAKIVVSPIQVGGGMKTKTAEALMYGKTILGSREAFEGYEIDDECMLLCKSENDYIYQINTLSNFSKYINLNSRDLYKKYYNNNILQKRFNSFVANI